MINRLVLKRTIYKVAIVQNALDSNAGMIEAIQKPSSARFVQNCSYFLAELVQKIALLWLGKTWKESLRIGKVAQRQSKITV